MQNSAILHAHNHWGNFTLMSLLSLLFCFVNVTEEYIFGTLGASKAFECMHIFKYKSFNWFKNENLIIQFF